VAENATERRRQHALLAPWLLLVPCSVGVKPPCVCSAWTILPS